MEKREGLGGGILEGERGREGGGRGKKPEQAPRWQWPAGPGRCRWRLAAGPTENTKGEQVLVRAHLGDRAAWAFDRAFCSVPNLDGDTDGGLLRMQTPLAVRQGGSRGQDARAPPGAPLAPAGWGTPGTPERGLEDSPVVGWTVNVLLLCRSYSMPPWGHAGATGKTRMHESCACGCVPIKLYSYTQQWAGFGPRAAVCRPLV